MSKKCFIKLETWEDMLNSYLFREMVKTLLSLHENEGFEIVIEAEGKEKNINDIIKEYGEKMGLK